MAPKTIPPGRVEKYAADFRLPMEIAQILAGRFPVYEEASLFLHAGLDHLHEPVLLPDIDRASDTLCDAVRSGRKILIYGHDDPDGFTAAAIVYKTLIDITPSGSEQVNFYTINRETDGYIINADVLKQYRQAGAEVVVTVDFGVSNLQNYQIPAGLGFDFIVCDHHESVQTRFLAPTIDPKRPDSRYPYRHLAGVGVAMKLCQALYERVFHLTAREFYSLKKEFFILTLIGTVADRAPMNGENRILCRYGLCYLDQVNQPWLDGFRYDGDITLSRICTDIIPTLVSAAYLDPSLGVKLLTAPDFSTARKIINRLRLATEMRRREIEDLFPHASEAAKIFNHLVVSVLPMTKIHYQGPLATRLKDYYQKNTALIGIRGEVSHGEMRSAGLDLYDMLHDLENLFSDYGGHTMAAGFTMPTRNLDSFIKQANRYTEFHQATPAQSMLIPEAVLDKSRISIMSPLMPFGEGNPAPILTDGKELYTIDNRMNIINKGTWQT